jgi:hypothetical protein
MNKYTPGPWEASFGDDGAVISNGCVTVANIPLDADRYSANARLIAAAPDLLAALELCERSLEERNTELETHAAKKAREAIAKAKGE